MCIQKFSATVISNFGMPRIIASQKYRAVAKSKCVHTGQVTGKHGCGKSTLLCRHRTLLRVGNNSEDFEPKDGRNPVDIDCNILLTVIIGQPYLNQVSKFHKNMQYSVGTCLAQLQNLSHWYSMNHGTEKIIQGQDCTECDQIPSISMVQFASTNFTHVFVALVIFL